MTGRGEVRAYIKDVLLPSATDECVIWPYSINRRHGYGRVAWRGHKYRSHRLVCQLVHGEPPPGKIEAAHSCGVKACCNPRHLRWATPAENMADCKAHGTLVVGSKHPFTSLNECDVGNIRQQLAIGVGQGVLHRFYGVSRSTISRIALGQSWGHVGSRDTQPKFKGIATK